MPIAAKPKLVIRDRCLRLKLTYNNCYNSKLSFDLNNSKEYFSYDFGEPFFDDRNGG